MNLTMLIKQTGITDIEIHFLQIKFTAIGVYLNLQDILSLLNNWKGKTADELAQDDDFFDALITGTGSYIYGVYFFIKCTYKLVFSSQHSVVLTQCF